MHRCKTRRRGKQRGVESLELVAALPLVGLLVAISWQGVVLLRQQMEAEADARALARIAVLCPRTPIPALTDVDPNASGEVTTTNGKDSLVTVKVRLSPQLAVKDFTLPPSLSPTAELTMRHEPC